MKTTLLIVSLLLFAMSAYAHVISFFGIPAVKETGAIVLHLGMLVMGLIAATVIHKPAYSYGDTKIFWRKHLPSWFKTTWLILFAYGFITIAWAAYSHDVVKQNDEIHGRVLANRIFSAGWMFLYSISLGIFYAVFNHQKENRA
jgi:hypothetical protein